MCFFFFVNEKILKKALVFRREEYVGMIIPTSTRHEPGMAQRETENNLHVLRTCLAQQKFEDFPHDRQPRTDG
jgi:hypothetical protein